MYHCNCKKCGAKYDAPTTGNTLYICPYCFEYVSSLSDYGFGPITPCEIMLGDKQIGVITERATYHLECKELEIDVDLSGKYKNLEVYREASEIISNKLKEMLV